MGGTVGFSSTHPGTRIPESPRHRIGAVLLVAVILSASVISYLQWSHSRSCYPSSLLPSPLNSIGCARALILGPDNGSVDVIAHGDFTLAWRFTGDSALTETCAHTLTVQQDVNAVGFYTEIKVSPSTMAGRRTFTGQGHYWIIRPGVCPGSGNLIFAVAY